MSSTTTQDKVVQEFTPSKPQFEGEENRWELRWKHGQTGWDLGKRHPELYRLHKDLSSALYQDLKLENGFKKALVPGCGSGYDVFSLCEIAGMERVVGLDVAPTANERANQLRAEMGEPYSSVAQFLVGNFFEFGRQGEHLSETFDLCFDYTFLCAMNVEDREKWAQSYARLLRRGGRLLTMIFPLRKMVDADTGPPYQISLDLARDLLEKVGFECVYHGEPQESPEGRKGNEYVAIWQKK